MQTNTLTGASAGAERQSPLVNYKTRLQDKTHHIATLITRVHDAANLVYGHAPQPPTTSITGAEKPANPAIISVETLLTSLEEAVSDLGRAIARLEMGNS